MERHASKVFPSLLQVVLHAGVVNGCICTPRLFTRMPLRTCAKHVGPFCAAMDHAQAHGLHRDMLMVDAGAAYGTEATIARQRGHDVLSFECRLDEFQRLQVQFISEPRVHVEHVCLSNASGAAMLLRASHSSSLLASSVGSGGELRLANIEAQKQEVCAASTSAHRLGRPT